MTCVMAKAARGTRSASHGTADFSHAPHSLTLVGRDSGRFGPLCQVGMYGYEVDSHLLRSGGALPVVMTVEPSTRRKTLTVHGLFQLKNGTSHPLDGAFRIGAGLLRTGNNASSLAGSLPSTIPAFHENYLPVPAGAGGHLKVTVAGPPPQCLGLLPSISLPVQRPRHISVMNEIG